MTRLHSYSAVLMQKARQLHQPVRLDVLDVRNARRPVLMGQLQWIISVHILTTASAQIAGHVKKPVQDTLFSEFKGAIVRKGQAPFLRNPDFTGMRFYAMIKHRKRKGVIQNEKYCNRSCRRIRFRKIYLY